MGTARITAPMLSREIARAAPPWRIVAALAIYTKLYIKTRRKIGAVGSMR
jgi:hypothetical protein